MYTEVQALEYLFFVGIDEVTRDLQGEVPWCVMFAEGVRVGLDIRL